MPPGPGRPPRAGEDCLGIIAGFGRGIPGRAGALPSRAVAGGREPRCIPCVGENGLLPGRAPPGRGAAGRGSDVPGLGAAGATTSGVSVAAGATGAAAAATTGAAGSTTGSGSTALAGPGLGPGRGAMRADPAAEASTTTWAGASAAAGGLASTGAAGVSTTAAGSAAAFLAGFFLASPWARSLSPCSSLSRRTTGASTVEDADFTYSPMSFNADRTILLSTPNSRASSWTLTATILLQGIRTLGGAQTAS